MRRLIQHDRDDQGVVTLLVVGLVAGLLVAMACAVDVGRYVVASWSAQNSADATVLAVATDCARNGAPIADYSQYYKTGQSINTPVCGSGETTITVTKPVSDGLLLNSSRRTEPGLQRRATAKWGTIGSATTLPITISDCEFTEALLDGTTDIVLYLDDPKPQSGCSSLPGGFSQLEADDDCAVEVSAGGTVPGDPGGDVHKQVPCITNPTSPPLPHDVLIPMYDAEVCQADPDCKGHGPYTIVGFAMFRVTGYSFNGSNYDGTLDNKCPTRPDESPSDTPKYCIQGDFIKFVTSAGDPGPSTDFGTSVVYLSS